jgi:hypothetical protein
MLTFQALTISRFFRHDCGVNIICRPHVLQANLFLKWSARNFEIFSNIKLIILKKLYVVLDMELQTKKFYLVWFARKKIPKSVIATNAPLHHMRKTRTIYSNFFEPKNFKLSVYNLLSEF